VPRGRELGQHTTGAQAAGGLTTRALVVDSAHTCSMIDGDMGRSTQQHARAGGTGRHRQRQRQGARTLPKRPMQRPGRDIRRDAL
jgi:hypothetical protein